MDKQVVELEISLDETREQYNNVLKSSNNRAQQKKMMFLERNLEQLTVVQRQLVEQNSSLKKEVAIAERKLIARNDAGSGEKAFNFDFDPARPHPALNAFRNVEKSGLEDATATDGRLLYVGVTRARTALLLTYTGEQTPLLPPNRSLYVEVEG